MNHYTALHNLSNITVIAPCKINPEARLVEREAEKLCKQLGIYLPNLHDYNTMSGYLFPYTSADRLLAITMFNNLLFYIDDQLDRNHSHTPNPEERQRLFGRLIVVFKTGIVHDNTNVLETATLKVRDLILPLAHPKWLKRLITNTQSHLQATTYNNNANTGNSSGDMLVNHYISVREHDSGMVPTVDLIEFANDTILPDFILEHPTLIEAIRATTRVAALMNDIFSYHREVMVQGSSFNLIAVMMNAHQLSFEDALEKSIRYLNNAIRTFTALEHQLPQFDDAYLTEQVYLYYQSLKDQINAAWHWQLSGTGRYRSPYSPFLELRD